ncbi:MAG: LCP family protein, partial [Planctomycetota bacterium]
MVLLAILIAAVLYWACPAWPAIYEFVIRPRLRPALAGPDRPALAGTATPLPAGTVAPTPPATIPPTPPGPSEPGATPTAVPASAVPGEPTSPPPTPPAGAIVSPPQTGRRVNVLFLGIDQRPGESMACRTDSIMLVSVDPDDMSASVLSIPRDLWVEIPHPDHEEDRINTAHFWGEEDRPGGGPALAVETVEHNLGVTVHYYVRLDFAGFERIIDAIGGVDIDVPAAIPSLLIEAGSNHFDGERALAYARWRATGDGDFTRMQRQQQIVLAVRDKVLGKWNALQMALRAPKLMREVGDALDTDVPVEVMFRLAEWAQQIEREDIRTATIDRTMTTGWMTPRGEAVLLWDR